MGGYSNRSTALDFNPPKETSHGGNCTTMDNIYEAAFMFSCLDIMFMVVLCSSDVLIECFFNSCLITIYSLKCLLGFEVI